MKQFLDDVNQECLICRVKGDCRPRNEKCGVTRGIKYGLYPKNAHSFATMGVRKDIYMQRSCGHKDKPLFELGEMMAKFCEDVARYTEPAIEIPRFGDMDL